MRRCILAPERSCDATFRFPVHSRLGKSRSFALASSSLSVRKGGGKGRFHENLVNDHRFQCSCIVLLVWFEIKEIEIQFLGIECGCTFYVCLVWFFRWLASWTGFKLSFDDGLCMISLDKHTLIQWMQAMEHQHDDKLDLATDQHWLRYPRAN